MKRSYEKNWQFDINRAYGDDTTTITSGANYLVWYFKSFLTGQVGGATRGLWSICGSSDGLTASLDGTDRWTTTFNESKLVHASTAHSWMVLQSPPINKHIYYVLFDLNSATTTAMSMYLGVDGTPTGGTISAAPTLPNSQRWFTNPTTYFQTSNPGSIHVHGALASDGSFNILESRDNTGKFATCLMGHWVANAKPTDNYPFWLCQVTDQAMGTGFGAGGYGLDNTANGIMRAPDNSLGGNWAGILPALTNYPVNIDPFDGQSLDWDIWIGATATAYRSVRGRLQDVQYANNGALTGSIDGTTGMPSFMIVGNYWFPTNEAPIL